MAKILLVCNAGMSTSMLVQRMEKEAQAQNIELEITAKPVTEAMNCVKDWDIVMLGPQVRHQLKSLQQAAGDVPVVVIDMRAYGMMDGKKVLTQAFDTLKK